MGTETNAISMLLEVFSRLMVSSWECLHSSNFLRFYCRTSQQIENLKFCLLPHNQLRNFLTDNRNLPAVQYIGMPVCSMNNNKIMSNILFVNTPFFGWARRYDSPWCMKNCSLNFNQYNIWNSSVLAVLIRCSLQLLRSIWTLKISTHISVTMAGNSMEKSIQSAFYFVSHSWDDYIDDRPQCLHKKTRLLVFPRTLDRLDATL